jgi:hypothetical protein
VTPLTLSSPTKASLFPIMLVAWGKDRAYYIMDRNGMGHFRPTENAIAQFAPDMTKAQNPGQGRSPCGSHSM